MAKSMTSCPFLVPCVATTNVGVLSAIFNIETLFDVSRAVDHTKRSTVLIIKEVRERILSVGKSRARTKSEHRRQKVKPVARAAPIES